MNPFSFSYSGWMQREARFVALPHMDDCIALHAGGLSLFLTFEQADGLRDALIAIRPVSVTVGDPQ